MLRFSAVLIIALVFTTLCVLGWINLTHNPEANRELEHLPQKIQTWAHNTELNILTYNVQDLALVSSHRAERMQGIGEFLATKELDVVALQEAFIENDRKILMDALGDAPLAKFHKYFESGLVGSGLMILSRYPIHDHAFKRFSNNGKWYKIHHGDWWAAKGIAVVRLEIMPGAFLDLYNTHLQAEYLQQQPHEYTEVRLDQIGELAQFVNTNRSPAIPQLLLGDMNFPANSPESELANQLLELNNLTHPQNRIDYIFGVTTANNQWELIINQILTPSLEVDRHSVSLSDHAAFFATIKLALDVQVEQ